MSYIAIAHTINQTVTANDITALVTIHFELIEPADATKPESCSQEEHEAQLHQKCIQLVEAAPSLSDAVKSILKHRYSPDQPASIAPQHLVDQVIHSTKQAKQACIQTIKASENTPESPLAQQSMFSPPPSPAPDNQAGAGAKP